MQSKNDTQADELPRSAGRSIIARDVEFAELSAELEVSLKMAKAMLETAERKACEAHSLMAEAKELYEAALADLERLRVVAGELAELRGLQLEGKRRAELESQHGQPTFASMVAGPGTAQGTE